MKKYTLFFVSAALILLLGGLVTLNIFTPKTNISTVNASLTYIYEERRVNTPLLPEESLLLKNIFNNKKLYSDTPSCGFTENVSVRFNDLVFCIACDDCPIIKLGNKYFKISTSDRKTIEQIFEKYGGLFPCV